VIDQRRDGELSEQKIGLIENARGPFERGRGVRVCGDTQRKRNRTCNSTQLGNMWHGDLLHLLATLMHLFHPLIKPGLSRPFGLT
jgi:hypothetical protein